MQVEKTSLLTLNFLQILVFLNFFLYIIEVDKLLLIYNSYLIFFSFFFLIFFRIHKELTFPKLTILTLSIISLSSPLISMDGRGIWMFHAKRIFFDHNIYATFDNYLGMFQNDYPTMVTSLSASIGLLIGGWNEIFPKFACLIFFVSPFIYLSMILKNKLHQIFFCIIVLILLEKRIIIGEMDALISIYFLCVAVGLVNLSTKISKFSNTKLLNQDTIFLFINISIFSLIKTEAIGGIFILFFVTTLSLIISKIRLSKLLGFFSFGLFSLFPWMYWKYKTHNFMLNSTSSTWFDLQLINERVFEFSLYFKIFHLILFNTHTIVALLLFIHLLSKINWNNISFNKKLNFFKEDYTFKFILILFLSSSIYLMVIFFGILTSNFLYSSFNEIGKNYFRYSLPVSLTISFLSIYLNDKIDLFYISKK